jgi:hypothetical protein
MSADLRAERHARRARWQLIEAGAANTPNALIVIAGRACPAGNDDERRVKPVFPAEPAQPRPILPISSKKLSEKVI